MRKLQRAALRVFPVHTHVFVPVCFFIPRLPWFLGILLLFGVRIHGFAQDAPAWYEGKPIKDIVFEGLHHVDTAEMDGIAELFRGQVFTDTVFSELQGRLYATEYFETINPSAVPANKNGTEVILKFIVTERPVVGRIVFAGNANMRRPVLLEAISLKEGDIATDWKLTADQAAIRDKYLEKGYPDVTVQATVSPGKDGAVLVTFTINEGIQIAIEAIYFEGISVFSERTLRGQLSLKPKGLINSGAFQQAKLVADRAAIVQYYHDRGYIDAEVVDAVPSPIRQDEKGHNLITITFKISEGIRYVFGGVKFVGNTLFPTEQLEGLITSKIGEIVNARKVEADLQRVSDLYYENGYIFNTINREEDKNNNRGIVSYTITIVERGRAHIERITVKGNEKTKDYVILREIPLESGDVFSKAKVMEGLRNLYNLQYFSDVVPDTPPGSTENLMDLVITVEEQPTMDIQLGVTFSGTADPDQFPLSLMGKWTDRNFLGRGNILGAELNLSPDTQSLSLEYTQRWMFGLPFSAGFDFTVQHLKRTAAMDSLAPYFNGDEDYAYPDGFYSYQEYSNAAKIPPDQFLMDYNQWRISLGMSTGYRWMTPAGNVGIGGGIRTGFIINQYDDEIYRPFDPAIRDRNNRWTPANSLWASLYLDQRDLYYDPGKGYYFIQRVGLYGVFPIEQEHYVKTDTKAEYFITLFDIPVTEKWHFRSIFGIHTGLSFIFPQAGRDLSIENANKLTIDGMFVGRGWSDEYSNKGLALWENWAELRFPLVPGILAWDFFFDAAIRGVNSLEGNRNTIGQFFRGMRAEDWRFSFGGGIRFTIPQLPIRVSLAKRFKIVDGEVEWQQGMIWRTKGNDRSGIDVVLSFTISSY